MKLLNAFSVNMLGHSPARVEFTEIDREAAAKLAAAGLDSSVGHPDTATVFAVVLGAPVPCVRSTVTLLPGETALLGQYRGPRLPEGATALPEGASIQWLIVSVS